MGDEAERLVSYSAVEQLARSPVRLAPAPSTGVVCPGRRSTTTAPPRYGYWRCWAPLQSRGPVAMGLDDVQWMDLPLQAIIFAVRLLVACRTVHAGS